MSVEFDEVMQDAQWAVLHGRLDEALEAYAEAEALAETSIQRADVQAAVGAVRGRQGRFSESRDALELACALYGADVPAATWGNLGFARDNLGDFQAALAAHQNCIAAHGAERGAKHPRTLRKLADLAFSMIGLGRLDEAESTLESMVEELEQQAEHDPLEYARGLSKLGYFRLRSRRDPVGAVACFDRAEALRDACSLRDKSGKLLREGFPEDFEAVLLGHLAEALAALGRAEEAAALRAREERLAERRRAAAALLRER